jgi:membrane associated rhomboid family serine protease
MLFPDVRLQLLFPPVALKAKWFVLIYGAIELLLAIGNMPGDSIAHYAHLGGMLFGYLMLKFWNMSESNRYY